MLPVNPLLVPQTEATPFWESRLGNGVSLAVIDRLRKVAPPAQGVRVGVSMSAGPLTVVAGGPLPPPPGGCAAAGGGVAPSLTASSKSNPAAATIHTDRCIPLCLLPW